VLSEAHHSPHWFPLKKASKQVVTAGFSRIILLVDKISLLLKWEKKDKQKKHLKGAERETRNIWRIPTTTWSRDSLLFSFTQERGHNSKWRTRLR